MIRKAAVVFDGDYDRVDIGAGDVRASSRRAAAKTTNWVGFAAALALGVAAAGGGLGQGRATAAACESTARNPGAADPFVRRSSSAWR